MFCTHMTSLHHVNKMFLQDQATRKLKRHASDTVVCLSVHHVVAVSL